MHTTAARCARLPDAPWTLSRSFSWYCTCTCQEVKKNSVGQILAASCVPHIVLHMCICRPSEKQPLSCSCRVKDAGPSENPLPWKLPQADRWKMSAVAFVLCTSTAVVLSICITQVLKYNMPCFPPVNYYFCVFLCIFHRRSRENKLIMPYVFVSFFSCTVPLYTNVWNPMKINNSEHILRQQNWWQPPQLLLIYLKTIETQKMVVYILTHNQVFFTRFITESH